jgi:hypothetical protein
MNFAVSDMENCDQPDNKWICNSFQNWFVSDFFFLASIKLLIHRYFVGHRMRAVTRSRGQFYFQVNASIGKVGAFGSVSCQNCKVMFVKWLAAGPLRSVQLLSQICEILEYVGEYFRNTKEMFTFFYSRKYLTKNFDILPTGLLFNLFCVCETVRGTYYLFQ